MVCVSHGNEGSQPAWFLEEVRARQKVMLCPLPQGTHGPRLTLNPCDLINVHIFFASVLSPSKACFSGLMPPVVKICMHVHNFSSSDTDK